MRAVRAGARRRARTPAPRARTRRARHAAAGGRGPAGRDGTRRGRWRPSSSDTGLPGNRIGTRRQEPDMTDAEAIARSLRHPSSFEVVFERHLTAIFRYLRRRAGGAAADLWRVRARTSRGPSQTVPTGRFPRAPPTMLHRDAARRTASPRWLLARGARSPPASTTCTCGAPRWSPSGSRAAASASRCSSATSRRTGRRATAPGAAAPGRPRLLSPPGATGRRTSARLAQQPDHGRQLPPDPRRHRRHEPARPRRALPADPVALEQRLRAESGALGRSTPRHATR